MTQSDQSKPLSVSSAWLLIQGVGEGWASPSGKFNTIESGSEQ